jgi:LysM repeat protein
MSLDSHAERRIVRLQRHLRFYRTFSAVLLLLTVVLVAVVVVRGRYRFARAIQIDGEIVCLVKDTAAAQRVHELLLTEAKGDLPGEAALEQQWSDETWRVDDRDVLSVKEAVELLKGKVNVKVGACVIEVDGVKAVTVPTKEVAEVVLNALKASYVKEGDTIIKQSFLEKVTPLPTQARASDVTTDVHRAVRALSGTKQEQKTYVVQRGDHPEKIARDHGMQLAELKRLNPEIVGAMLQPGQKLTVAEPRAAITVRTVKEVTDTEPREPETREIRDPNIPRGERRVAAEGEPGEKLVRYHYIYHNDQFKRKDPISGQWVKRPVERRVLIGTGDRPEPEPASRTSAPGGGRPAESETSER